MRVLMLSCNTGEGHNSTGKAIMEAMDRQGIQSEMMDALSFLSPKFSDFICKWFVRLYRYAPKLFDVGYRMAEQNPVEPGETDLVYEALAFGAEKLQQILESGSYDAIVCVHVFSGMMVTELRRQGKVTIPCFLTATDYSCVPYTEQCEADGYFIPARSMVGEFAAAGLPREKLFPYGIPVRGLFYSRRPRQEARALLGLPENGTVALLMCGSMGCGPMRKIARGLAESLPENGTLVVFCGRNERLREALEDLQSPRFRVLGFTQDVPDYMDAANMMITKPGGLSSTEAANKHLPMVLINAIGGCEMRNFELFLEHGYAVGSKSAAEVLALSRQLFEHPEQLEQMEENMRRDFTCNSADEIALHVIRAVSRRSK